MTKFLISQEITYNFWYHLDGIEVIHECSKYLVHTPVCSDLRFPYTEILFIFAHIRNRIGYIMGMH